MPNRPRDGQSFPSDDAALLSRIQAGDPQACTECVDRHAPSIYRLALRLMGNEADAEDVMQETFLSAFKGVEHFEGRSDLGTWLYRIAHNAALMRLRRREPTLVPVDPTEWDDGHLATPHELFDWCCLPERDFETAEARAELESAVRALPEALRAVFVLRELEGLSTDATAEVLSLSAEAVKSRLHRARLWLRERLSEYFAELDQRRRGM